MVLAGLTACTSGPLVTGTESDLRERTSLNTDWQFFLYPSADEADGLIYDVRPEVEGFRDDRNADTRPDEAVDAEKAQDVLKAWILPTVNPFIKNHGDRHVRPQSNPGSDFPFVQADFDDRNWETVDLPHDWAIKGPFLKARNPRWVAEWAGCQ